MKILRTILRYLYSGIIFLALTTRNKMALNYFSFFVKDFFRFEAGCIRPDILIIKKVVYYLIVFTLHFFGKNMLNKLHPGIK